MKLQSGKKAEAWARHRQLGSSVFLPEYRGLRSIPKKGTSRAKGGNIRFG